MCCCDVIVHPQDRHRVTPKLLHERTKPAEAAKQRCREQLSIVRLINQNPRPAMPMDNPRAINARLLITITEPHNQWWTDLPTHKLRLHAMACTPEVSCMAPYSSVVSLVLN